MSKDTIYRGDAIDEMERIMADHPLQGYEDELLLIDAIKSLPSADRPQGKWIKDYYGTVICSECKCPRRDNRIGHTKFCNACGARMEGADE